MHSQEYLKELQLLHSKKTFGVAKNIPQGVQDLISKKELTSVLDFGCGKGMPFTQLKDVIDVYNYDPVTSPINLPEKTDLVYSSDVLEHIEDDNKAMNELYRVLNKNGTAILQVPIDLKKQITYEDINIKTEKERMEKFGQYDHLRIYGLDYFDKLEKIGFRVEKNKYATKFSEIEMEKYGIIENEIIPVCKKY